MNLNHIKSFLAVTQTLNFTNAAKQLGVPQSTISRQINDLEQQLEVKLFFRTKRDVQLTEEGRTFLPYAQEILNAAKKGAYAVKQLHDGARGRLSIATIPTIDSFLTDCLHTFGERYPDIVIDITYVSCSNNIMEDTEHAYDFHFHYLDMLPDNDEFETYITHMEQLNLVVPKEHPLARQEKLDTSLLHHEKFILVSEEENPILYMEAMNYCRIHRFTPHVINHFNDIKSVLLCVSAGLGITILPLLPSQFNMLSSSSIHVIPLDDLDVSIPCAVAWRKSLLNPAAMLFREILKEKITPLQTL